MKNEIPFVDFEIFALTIHLLLYWRFVFGANTDPIQPFHIFFRENVFHSHIRFPLYKGYLVNKSSILNYQNNLKAL